MQVTEKKFPFRQLVWPSDDSKKGGVCVGNCTDDSDCDDDLLKCVKVDLGGKVPGCLNFPESVVPKDSTAQFCVEKDAEKSDLEFNSIYGDKNVFFGNGGSFVNDNKKIILYGNAWKAFELQKPYNVTGNTYVSFMFELTDMAEGHAICFDDDNDPDTYGGSQKRCIALAGSEFDYWDEHHILKHNANFNETADEPQIVHVHQKIGNFFNQKGSQIKYVGFIQDNDSSPYQGISSFWDVQFYEVEPVSTCMMMTSTFLFPICS